MLLDVSKIRLRSCILNSGRDILLVAGWHEVETAKKGNGLPRQTTEKSSIFKGF